MGKKELPISEERDKYEVITDATKRTGKTKELTEQITTSLYAGSAKTSGFVTSSPILWLETFEKYYLSGPLTCYWLNIENKDGKYCESQLYLHNALGIKCLTIHVYITTGVILAKGSLWRAWANLEFPALYSMISENKTDAVCPSKEFIGVLNKTQSLPNRNATKPKEEASKHVEKTDKRTSPDTDNSNKKDESVDIINDEDDEDIFYSVEHLWEENSALKSSLNTLENSLLTITETLSEARKA